MKPNAAKLACVSNGLTFEEWRIRPVYRVHCHTFRVARSLLNLPELQGGMVTVYGAADSSGLTLFRALAPYRSQEANALRQRVARHLRANSQHRKMRVA